MPDSNSGSWVRVDPSRLKNLGFDPDFEAMKVFRVYSLKAKTWPRMVLSVTETHSKLISINCSVKMGPSRWWETYDGIPRELLGDLSELIAEAKVALDAKQNNG